MSRFSAITMACLSIGVFIFASCSKKSPAQNSQAVTAGQKIGFPGLKNDTGIQRGFVGNKTTLTGLQTSNLKTNKLKLKKQVVTPVTINNKLK